MTPASHLQIKHIRKANRSMLSEIARSSLLKYCETDRSNDTEIDSDRFKCEIGHLERWIKTIATGRIEGQCSDIFFMDISAPSQNVQMTRITENHWNKRKQKLSPSSAKASSEMLLKLREKMNPVKIASGDSFTNQIISSD
jgi:hypothetical protein